VKFFLFTTFDFYYLKIKTKNSFPVISIFYPSSGRDSIIYHNPSFVIENFWNKILEKNRSPEKTQVNMIKML
jgi:hypothetical protein